MTAYFCLLSPMHWSDRINKKKKDYHRWSLLISHLKCDKSLVQYVKYTNVLWFKVDLIDPLSFLFSVLYYSGWSILPLGLFIFQLQVRTPVCMYSSEMNDERSCRFFPRFLLPTLETSWKYSSMCPLLPPPSFFFSPIYIPLGRMELTGSLGAETSPRNSSKTPSAGWGGEKAESSADKKKISLNVWKRITGCEERGETEWCIEIYL